MNDTKLLMMDITKVIDLLPENENKYELINLFFQLTDKIETQQDFIKGVSEYLLQKKQFDDAKENALIYAHNKQYEEIKVDSAKLQSRGMKVPYAYPYTFEIDCLFDDVKFDLEN